VNKCFRSPFLPNIFYNMFEVLKAVKMSILVSWFVRPCGLNGKKKRIQRFSAFFRNVFVNLQIPKATQARRPTSDIQHHTRLANCVVGFVLCCIMYNTGMCKTIRFLINYTWITTWTKLASSFSQNLWTLKVAFLMDLLLLIIIVPSQSLSIRLRKFYIVNHITFS
jgi:hypothetical protein